ncbi:putative ephrin-receptor like protein [Gracilaria domingensis]|nr:putative ephrin-receptor like protein [Gracilaria domingensis]
MRSLSPALNRCVDCGVNSFNPFFGATECSPCPEGTFAPQGSQRCIPCSEGGALRSRFRCGPCPEFHAGNLNTFDTELACVRTLQANLRSLPTPRPGPDGMLQQALCPNGLGAEFEGRAFDLSKCTFVGCPDGTGVLKDGSCAKCSPGSFYNRLTNQCELCAPRFFTAQENVFSSCFSCGGDSFSMRGATECVKCPINQALMADGKCDTCPPGTFYLEEELRCVPCEINTYSDGELQMNMCSACPDGTFSFPGSRTCREDLCGRDMAPLKETGECGTCPPGMQYSKDGTCTMCVDDFLDNIPRVKVNFGLFGCQNCGRDRWASADRTMCTNIS